MPAPPIHQEKSVSPIPGQVYGRRSVELDTSTPAQGVSHDVGEVFPNGLTDSSGATHRRRIPTPLVLLSASSKSQRNMQPTSPDHTLSSSPVVDIITDGKPLLRNRSIVHQTQSNPAHHVKMGIHHSCPRTPLRSAGSSAGLTPTINRWQDSETKYDSSIQSLPGTEDTQSTEELHPALFLPNHKPLNLDLGLDHIWPSPTSTVRTAVSGESSTSYSGSIYSNDSDDTEEAPQLHGAFLCTSVSLRRPSTEKSTSSPELCSASSAIDQDSDSHDFKSPPDINTRSVGCKANTNMVSIKCKPRVHSAITPSPMKESTKTIQVKRSFGQLLLFRRPSQIQVSLTDQVSPFANGNETWPEDEEKEELQTNVGNDRSHVSAQSFRALAGRSRSMIGFNKPNQREDEIQTSCRSRAASNDLAFCSKSADCTMQDYQDQALGGNDSTNSRRSSTLDRPKGLLKLVKSHSSLGQKIFRSRSQSCTGLQLYDKSHHSLRSPSVPGSKQDDLAQDCNRFWPNVLKSSRGNDAETYRPIQLESQGLETSMWNDSQRSSRDATLVPKSAGSNQSSSLKFFKFWKRNKVQKPTDLNDMKEELKTKNKHAQKRPQDDEKKSPVASLNLNFFRNSGPRIKTSPSLLHLHIKDNRKQKNLDAEICSARKVSISSSGWPHYSETLVGPSIGNGGYKLPSVGDGAQHGYTENISPNLPNPTRPR